MNFGEFAIGVIIAFIVLYNCMNYWSIKSIEERRRTAKIRNYLAKWDYIEAKLEEWKMRKPADPREGEMAVKAWLNRLESEQKFLEFLMKHDTDKYGEKDFKKYIPLLEALHLVPPLVKDDDVNP